MTEYRATHCVSSGVGLGGKGDASFPCPRCDEVLGRSGSVREQAVPYTCPSCGFQGP